MSDHESSVLLRQEPGILLAVQVEKLGIMHELISVLTLKSFYYFVTVDVSLATIIAVNLRLHNNRYSY